MKVLTALCTCEWEILCCTLRCGEGFSWSHRIAELFPGAVFSITSQTLVSGWVQPQPGIAEPNPCLVVSAGCSLKGDVLVVTLLSGLLEQLWDPRPKAKTPYKSPATATQADLMPPVPSLWLSACHHLPCPKIFTLLNSPTHLFLSVLPTSTAFERHKLLSLSELAMLEESKDSLSAWRQGGETTLIATHKKESCAARLQLLQGALCRKILLNQLLNPLMRLVLLGTAPVYMHIFQTTALVASPPAISLQFLPWTGTSNAKICPSAQG